MICLSFEENNMEAKIGGVIAVKTDLKFASVQIPMREVRMDTGRAVGGRGKFLKDKADILFGR
jgi:hypothetical protein